MTSTTVSGGDDHDTERVPRLVAALAAERVVVRYANSAQVAKVRALLGSGAERQLALYAQPERLSLGRGTACEWQLDDPTLGRRHAVLHWNGRGLVIEDCGSANGTCVGGRRIRTAALGPGAAAQLGTVRLIFEPAAAADLIPTQLVDPQPRRSSLAPRPRAPRPLGFEPAAVVSPPPLPPPAPLPVPQPAPGVLTIVREVAPSPKTVQVFVPDAHAASPEEPTRKWDPRAALVPARRLAAARLWIERSWGAHRRVFFIAGIALLALLGAAALCHLRATPGAEVVIEHVHTSAPPPMDARGLFQNRSQNTESKRPAARTAGPR